jgi:hypothetical protein
VVGLPAQVTVTLIVPVGIAIGTGVVAPLVTVRPLAVCV